MSRGPIQVLSAVCLLCLLWSGVPVSSYGREIKIPAVAEWTDQGVVLHSGNAGSWDARLTGMLNPCTLIKKNGTYFLYYLGASGNRTTDNGPAFRALGVATSTDGRRFVKYGGNPILRHQPHHNQEEGIFSAGSTLDEQGDIVLHYGAIWAGDSTTESVRSYIALATSGDGFTFNDKGYILGWDDRRVWGYGDELSPIGSFRANARWYVYYIAKGSHVPLWSLGLAWGAVAGSLPHTKAAVAETNFVAGGGDPVLLGNGKLALFVSHRDSSRETEVWTAPLSDPARLSGPVETYRFERRVYGLTVFLDEASGKWLMYYLSDHGRAIRLMTAPVTYAAGSAARPVPATPSDK